MPLAAIWATTIVAFLADAVKGLVGRVLVALGIGAVTAVGVGALFTQATSLMAFPGVGGANFQAALTAVGLPWFLATIVSAISTRLVLKGLTSDGVSFWVMRRSIG